MNKQELIEKYEDKLKDIQLKFGANFKTKVYEGLVEDLRQLDEPQKVTIPQFVAEWIDTVKNKQKKDFRFNNEVIHSDDVYRVMFGILREGASTQEVKNWVVDNADTFSLAWILGYTVEKEKRYLVKMKGMTDGCSYLNYCKIMDKWFLGGDSEMVGYHTRHTRKELEEAGFGGVFGNPLFEVEEKNNE